jgi:toxin-antitoxin system PIN domain toxin
MTRLPDVNVLIALIWEGHIHHAAARRWFAAAHEGGWATCSVTQTGFVRVSANPRAVGDAVSVREATALLAALVSYPSHRFLADDQGFVTNPLVPHERLVGHRQVTDGHLIAIARRHEARVVTFDQAMPSLGGDSVELVPN